jgi:hypothetical protein
MKHKLASLIFLGIVVPAMAQQAPSHLPATNDVAPVISKLTISPDTVTDLRLKPFYAATIRMPEPVSSVVVGAPTLFLAEHNEHEPDLVVVKAHYRGSCGQQPVDRHQVWSGGQPAPA